MLFSIRCVVPPTDEPIGLAEAKAHLRVDHDADDALIDALITAAREQCESQTGRTLMQAGWEIAQPCFGIAVKLWQPPVQAITSVKYLDAKGVEQTLDASAYRATLSYSPAYLSPALGKNWPQTCQDNEAVKVRYTAGYADANAVPRPLRTWILLRIGGLYENRNSEIIGATSADLGQNFFNSLLDPYRVLVA